MPTALAQTNAKKTGRGSITSESKKITYSLARTKTKIRRWRHKHRKHVQKKQFDYNGGDWSVTGQKLNSDARSFAPFQRPRRGKVIPLEYLSATHQRPINFIGKAFEDAPFIFFFLHCWRFSAAIGLKFWLQSASVSSNKHKPRWMNSYCSAVCTMPPLQKKNRTHE